MPLKRQERGDYGNEQRYQGGYDYDSENNIYEEHLNRAGYGNNYHQYGRKGGYEDFNENSDYNRGPYGAYANKGGYAPKSNNFESRQEYGPFYFPKHRHSYDCNDLF